MISKRTKDLKMNFFSIYTEVSVFMNFWNLFIF